MTTAIGKSGVVTLLRGTIAATIAAAMVPMADIARAEGLSSGGPVEYRWEVDMRGKPPYKRERVAVEFIDTASMEIVDNDVETEVVWQRDFTGRPPFRRQLVELPVVDAASMELVDEQPKSMTFRGRPPFKRHR